QVEGDPAHIETFLEGLTLEAATAPWADTNHVVVCSSDSAARQPVENLERSSDPVGLAEELQRASAANVEALAGRTTTLVARVEASWSDSWAATIAVVPAATTHPEALEQLRRAA